MNRQNTFATETTARESFSSSFSLSDDEEEVDEKSQRQTQRYASPRKHQQLSHHTTSFTKNTSNKKTKISCSGKRYNYLRYCFNLLKKFNDVVESEGINLRKSLKRDDIHTIKVARLLFHCCSVLPPLFYYYLRKVDNPPKFPATISFTIRKGVPKYIQMFFWMSGWICMGKVMKRTGSQFVQKFCTKMVCTGLWTTVLFRLGRNLYSDICHFIGAGVYMLDHVVLMKLFNMRSSYRRIFYSSFTLLVLSLGGVRNAERLSNLPHESDNNHTTADRVRRISKLPHDLRRKLFSWELLVMVFENLLFMSFVQGMPSGLQLEDETEGAKVENEAIVTKDKIQKGNSYHEVWDFSAGRNSTDSK